MTRHYHRYSKQSSLNFNIPFTVLLKPGLLHYSEITSKSKSKSKSSPEIAQFLFVICSPKWSPVTQKVAQKVARRQSQIRDFLKSIWQPGFQPPHFSGGSIISVCLPLIPLDPGGGSGGGKAQSFLSIFIQKVGDIQDKHLNENLPPVSEADCFACRHNQP